MGASCWIPAKVLATVGAGYRYFIGNIYGVVFIIPFIPSGSCIESWTGNEM